MRLIIDANILFAALITPGITKDIIWKSNIQLLTPTFLLEELNNHHERILKKTKKTALELQECITILCEHITIIPAEELEPYLLEAATISPDPQDIAYLAAALLYNCPLWSNDKALKQQHLVQVYTTEELITQLTS
ncbi:MAG: PIN domain-containing protein [Nanoarchaeota archaeon]|nr:PIN domain-containing protein [Nanoarchaeota archaeon]